MKAACAAQSNARGANLKLGLGADGCWAYPADHPGDGGQGATSRRSARSGTSSSSCCHPARPSSKAMWSGLTRAPIEADRIVDSLPVLEEAVEFGDGIRPHPTRKEKVYWG